MKRSTPPARTLIKDPKDLSNGDWIQIATVTPSGKEVVSATGRVEGFPYSGNNNGIIDRVLLERDSLTSPGRDLTGKIIYKLGSQS